MPSHKVKKKFFFLFFKPNVIYVICICSYLFITDFVQQKRYHFLFFKNTVYILLDLLSTLRFFFSLLLLFFVFFGKCWCLFLCAFQSFFRCSHTQSAQLVFIFSGYVNVHDCIFGARNFIWFWCVSAFLCC